MISFIIIGKNIENTIEVCIKSIFQTIKENAITNSEILYIDSKSSDKTLKLIEEYPEVRIFSIVGECNAAIARNIGAKEAKGKSLFFIDGDMEIFPNFIPVIYDYNFNLKHPFVSGDLVNYFYDQRFNFLLETPYFKIKLLEDQLEYTTGGFFVIDKKLWIKIGGMNNSFRRGQDLDLGLRLAKAGNLLVRKKEIMAIHHTISYYDNKRFFNMLKNGDYLYPGLLLRKNFINIFTWRALKRSQSSMFLLAILLVLSLMISYYLIIIYFLSVLMRSILKRDRQNRGICFHILSFIIIDCTVIFGFLFYYPKKKEIIYKRYNNED